MPRAAAGGSSFRGPAVVSAAADFQGAVAAVDFLAVAEALVAVAPRGAGDHGA